MDFNYFTIILGFIMGFILFYKFPRLKKPNQSQNADLKISVVIPARNEEDNLPELLSDLKKQSFNLHEIICVDDNSMDTTPDIIRRFGAKCVKLNGLPEGWKGKPWACQNGAEAATGDILLFIDADVRLSDRAIESLATRYIEKGKPLSVKPYNIVKKSHEFYSLFFNLIELCVTGMSMIGKKKKVGLYGPLFMISKNLFNEYGGYSRVRNDVAEDFNLGMYYSECGVDIDLLLGSEEIQFRMYPKSFASLFEGWSKNFACGSVSMQWWLNVLIVIWIAFMTVLPYEIIRGALNRNLYGFIALCSLYLINVVVIYRITRKMGSYPLRVCVRYPLYLLMFHIIFIYSMAATFVFKTTTWKGRKL